MCLKAPKIQRHVQRLGVDGWDFIEALLQRAHGRREADAADEEDDDGIDYEEEDELDLEDLDEGELGLDVLMAMERDRPM